MVGQSLGRSVEAALEWRADYARGEERVLYYLSRPIICHVQLPRRSLDELVHPSGNESWENSTT
jgi:hypothetical protein